MRLLIISNMPHYLRGRTVVGWGPTVLEINHLAQLFCEVRHIGCLYNGPAPASSLPYESSKVTFIPVPPAGGPHLRDKLAITSLIPTYLQTMLTELRRTDAVHVRCPANTSLLAIILLALLPRPKPRWVKYAGNWRPDSAEARSYTVQRWWLQHRLHRGIVTVNGRWPDQPDYIYSFLNPCLTNEELELAHTDALAKALTLPVRLLYIGRLETSKGVGRALQIVHLLQQRNLPTSLDLVGDGPERVQFEQLAHALGITSSVTFHGWMPRTALTPIFSRAHILLLPSSSEGWPKVLSEGMAYGVVPIASAVSSIPQLLANTGAGFAVPPYDVAGFAEVIERCAENPSQWKVASLRGVTAATQFTYQAYIQAVQNMFQQTWGINLPLITV